MFKKLVVINGDLYALNVERSTILEEGYTSVVLQDKTDISVHTNSFNLMSYNPESKIMRELLSNYCSEEEQDKPYTLISKKRNS